MSRGSHPPTLLTLARRALTSELALPPRTKILVAVSGGPDSMALLHVLSRLRGKLGFDIRAHGVDHGLRPEAAAELDGAEAFAAKLGVPFDRTVVEVPPGGNVQARARDARYRALRDAARRVSADVIATAHHEEDRAETVLMRILRGSGPRGLAVLPPRAGDLIRPFIRAPRKAIDAHLERHAIPFARDPSNESRRFLRVRVRTEVLPLLRELNPRITEHLTALADQLAHETLEMAPAEALGIFRADDGDADDAIGLSGPRPIQREALRLPRRTQLALADLARFPSEKRSVELPEGVVATYDRGQHKVVTDASIGLRWKHRYRNGRHRKDG